MKWSRLAVIITERTEHNIKNRFYSILANHLSLTTRKVRTSRNYISKAIIEEIIRIKA